MAVPNQVIILLSGIPATGKSEFARAREVYVLRGGIAVTDFDRHIVAIQRAGYPASLDCLVVPALSAGGDFLDQRQIERIIFP